ncbi:DUF4221 domain-containing protein [Chitinophaga agrisoli]|uniref:DUF4221 domain-containing protein n=1 Tax=Chitinophaga agrisoli TaxID=2607653 RepID=A0A5B2VJH6_9BACT|nr:DUF4221 family protein [Chitinophaga agrisoli]KAA2239733.1 DUF4221 domain-containing protein [Chitinophaga agrisoli]
MFTMLPMRNSRIIFICFVLLQSSCLDLSSSKSTYRSLTPSYAAVQIVRTDDDIQFRLDSATFSVLKSFNYFIQDGVSYISFFDKQSRSVNIYDFYNRNLIKRISLKESFHKMSFYKTTVFCKNMDSIWVNNNGYLYFLDSLGQIRYSIECPTDPYMAVSAFDNLNPGVLTENNLYAEARPRMSIADRKNRKKWRVIYRFDLQNKTAKMLYHLPEGYIKYGYDYGYYYPSYCYNNQGHFVFSFPADTNIYETDFLNFNYAYNGKSQFQTGEIEFPEADRVDTKEDVIRRELSNDAYGAIYFDSHRRRYLRVAERKLSKADFINKRWKKEQSLIIFDENFRIIGESVIDRDIALSSLFFTNDGSMYARYKIEDDKALHFIRLDYGDSLESNKLASY